MNVCHILICFVLTLQGGNTLQDGILKVPEGGNITRGCSFTFSGDSMFFCKEDCKKGLLIKTTSAKAEKDRYSIEHSQKGILFSQTVYVSIRQLTRSDSGLYVCGLIRKGFPDSEESFEIIVETPNTSKPNWTLRPSTSSATTHSLSSSSGSFKSSSASPETTTQSVQQLERTAAPPAPSGKLLLYVGLILAVIILLLSLAVLFFFCRRTSEPKELHVETEYASVSGANREDIREDGQSRSPPVEMSSVYSYAKYTEPNGAEINDDYSLITAANSQNTAEDVSSGLTYSEVNFSMQSVGSSSSSVRGDDNVVYSVPRVETLHEEDDPYSTVSAELQG